MAQPFTIGSGYKRGGVAVVGINPGASSDGGYKEARLHALTRFAAGADNALPEYWSALAKDAEHFWNPRYLARVRALELEVASIVVGNIALCATDHNKYPTWMLRQCWKTHSLQMLETLKPGVVILMGSEAVMQSFGETLNVSSAIPFLRKKMKGRPIVPNVILCDRWLPCRRVRDNPMDLRGPIP